jgi:hypothetical protein
MAEIEIQWLASNASPVLVMRFELENDIQIFTFPKSYEKIP